MNGFGAGEERWIDGLGNLRNTVRQEMIRRQLADHITTSTRVLDVGCGQGTQLLELAALGCAATGVEPSSNLRDRCLASASERSLDVELFEGTIDQLDAILGARRFDLVCAHGLLMYLDDRAGAIATLADRVTPTGLLSVTFRSGHALAMRPGLRGDWRGALAAFGTDRYTNELGVEARADHLEDVTEDLDTCGFDVVEWYGVRVLNDAVDPSVTISDDVDVAALMNAEDQAGRRDPYRWLGSQLHVVATRR